MKYFLTLLALVIPTQSHAATFKQIVAKIIDFNQLLTSSIFALVFIVFAWKIIDAWIIKGGEPDAIEKGKKTIVVGVIVLVIMSGLWGILKMLSSVL